MPPPAETAVYGGLSVAQWLTAFGIIVSLVWNVVNLRKASTALRIARFQRDVASPLLDAVVSLERAHDLCFAILNERIPFPERQKRLADKLLPDCGLAHAALVRCLRRAIDSKRSKFQDWDEILADHVEDAALDAIAEAGETASEERFNELLDDAAQKLETIAARAREKIEREN